MLPKMLIVHDIKGKLVTVKMDKLREIYSEENEGMKKDSVDKHHLQ